MTTLSVNLNKIALLRNARGRNFPNISDFAHLALDNGADGITIHPRPDQRHATYDDIRLLADILTDYPNCELNIEGYPDPALLDVVCVVRPDQVTLVPDAPTQLTSDHGWNVVQHKSMLAQTLARLHDAGIRSSLFMDCDYDSISAAAELGAHRIELHTEPYARAAEQGGTVYTDVLANFAQHAQFARAAGLGVNAGHDLDLQNVASFCQACLPDEVSIGHALTVEALLYGFAQTVAQYVHLFSTTK